MKFKIVKESLLDILLDINGIVERKSTAPIISHVYIQAKENQLIFTGTDTEVTLTGSVAAEIFEEGEITVPAGKFLDVIKHMPIGIFIDCKLNDTQFQIDGGQSHFKLATLPAEDFPIFERSEQRYLIDIHSSELNHAMQKVRFSMAVQDVRYFLNGLYLRTLGEDNQLHAISTDGHRLSCYQTHSQNETDTDLGIILPKKAVNELVKLTSRFDETLHLAISQRQMNLSLANYQFSTNLIEGKYPNYQDVIPERQEQPVIAPRLMLLDALNRAKVLLVDRHDGIRLTFDHHTLHLAARNQDNETVDEHLDIINNRSDLIDVGFNINYLIEAINHIEGENVSLHFEDSDSPFMITSNEDEAVRYVIMPMRI